MNMGQKRGIIKMIQPNGGYQSSHGYISTFMMTLQTDEGQITGEIGSKSEIYPLNVNDPITVDIKNTTNGVKFKKVNPQYAQQGSQSTPQTPQNAPQLTNSPTDRDTCICRQCAGKVAGEVVAAYIRSRPANEPYAMTTAINDLLTISDAMAIWFIKGNQPQQDESDIGF